LSYLSQPGNLGPVGVVGEGPGWAIAETTGDAKLGRKHKANTAKTLAEISQAEGRCLSGTRRSCILSPRKKGGGVCGSWVNPRGMGQAEGKILWWSAPVSR
jgi:hypothetical protein